MAPLGSAGTLSAGTGGTGGELVADGGAPDEAGGVASVGGSSSLGGSPQLGGGGGAPAAGQAGGGGIAGSATTAGVGGSVAGQPAGGRSGAPTTTGGAAGIAGKSGAAGSGPVDQCSSMPGKLLVSYPATNAKIDGGTDPVAPPTTTHSLRVWFTSPAGYCDETFGGSTPPALTLNNNQTGDFALPGADLCFNGNMTGEIHIDPAGGFARVMGVGAGWVVQGICVRVRRNHWDVQFHVNGDVDETWELWGTD